MADTNDEGRQWYVVNTYSGHENKVKDNLLKRVESMGIQDCLFNILIPEHVETAIKDGKKVNVTRNMFPGYVLVEMIMTDEAWYVVRNTSGVTGFIGSSGGGAKPFPMAREEIEPILKRMGMKVSDVEEHFEIGEEVRLLEGSFLNKTGRLEAIDKEKQQARVIVNMMGSAVPVTMDLSKIEKVDY